MHFVRLRRPIDDSSGLGRSYHGGGATQSVCVADCYAIVNVLDLLFASPIYNDISLTMCINQ